MYILPGKTRDMSAKYFFSLIFFVGLLMSSCSSIMQFQEAEPLGKGTGEVMAGFGAGYYPGSLEDNNYGFPLMARSEEHTSELQSRENLVCRLLLEKKK